MADMTKITKIKSTLFGLFQTQKTPTTPTTQTSVLASVPVRPSVQTSVQTQDQPKGRSVRFHGGCIIQGLWIYVYVLSQAFELNDIEQMCKELRFMSTKLQFIMHCARGTEWLYDEAGIDEDPASTLRNVRYMYVHSRTLKGNALLRTYGSLLLCSAEIYSFYSLYAKNPTLVDVDDRHKWTTKFTNLHKIMKELIL